MDPGLLEYLDSFIRWAGRARLLRYAAPVVARLLGRLAIDVVEARNSQFVPGSQFEYRMLQLWLRNAIRSDAYNVVCQCEWRREGSDLNVQTVNGVWFEVFGAGMADIRLGRQPTTNLMSNGEEQHLGLVVKYDQDSLAYLVTPASETFFFSHHHWRHAGSELDPGSYRVTIACQSAGGNKTRIGLRVVNPGPNAPLAVEVLTHHSVE